MGTNVRPETSVKSKYWIDRHRYYELKHFCLQYPIWKKAVLALDGLSRCPESATSYCQTEHGDPTAKCAEAREHYLSRMNMVEHTAFEASPDLFSYLFKGVTEGLSYDYLKARLDIPCCKDVYYEVFRRFFWLLSKARN